jgi:hypothetical protein
MRTNGVSRSELQLSMFSEQTIDEDYLVAVDPLKDAIASSVLPNISKTVKNFVI